MYSELPMLVAIYEATQRLIPEDARTSCHLTFLLCGLVFLVLLRTGVCRQTAAVLLLCAELNGAMAYFSCEHPERAHLLCLTLMAPGAVLRSIQAAAVQSL
jgi:hypothetical protein